MPIPREGTDMTQQQAIEGGCTCGQVRYRMAREPMFVNCCHCQSCQKQSGAAFAINAMIEATNFEVLDGTIEMVDTPTDSGNGQKVHRCMNCKVAVWSNYAGAGEKINFVRVGTMDDPTRCPPNVHIFTRSKQPWVVLPKDVPAVDVYYDAKDLWPTESLGRQKAAMNDQKRA